ncbi:hypothetical protein ES703_120869 [subsurface metagenome]
MMHAAAPRVSPLHALATGSPASAPVASAIFFPAQAWSSVMTTKDLEESSMALKTSGSGMEPPRLVALVAALITRLMPYFSKGL